ncbi:MAG: hypothetical protein JWP69_487 [Flaviaesturariibacter sp.]|nr:hypothetical protein [Flaviaesturariibacter sp.]
MKQIIKLLFIAAFVSTALWSCKKDENKVYFEGGTAPVLTASATTPVTLAPANQSNVAMRFDWTNPNYKFTTGVSSQDVTYILQVDTTGANFTSPSMQEVSIPKELSTSFTVKELNTILTKLNVLEDMPHSIQFRIKSTLGNNSAVLFSNVLTRVITPYLDVAVPIPTAGNLWIVGDASPNGWNNPLQAAYVTTHKFTKVSNTLYELTLAMPGGGAYKLLQDNGNWATQYHMLAGGSWSSGDFEKRDADPGFPGPPTAGTYKITVNFKTGKYTVVKL